MTRTRLAALGLIAAVAAVACGGSTTESSGGSAGSSGGAGSGGAGGSGGSAGSGGAGGGTSNGCPATEPTGGACTVEGLRCTYGDSTRPDCRNVWTCDQGSWATTNSVCAEPPPGNCGSAPPADGNDCPNNGDVCAYPSGTICVCTNCSGGGPCQAGPPKWSCAAPPAQPGCPMIVPNEGTACDASGLECVYGDPCGISGADAVCQGGVWVWKQVMCAA